MPDPACVGAVIRDDRHRVFVQRRSPDRSSFPGVWDLVGGHVEAGETPVEALAREIEEETGWRLRRVEAVLSDWTWELDGVVRRELDYLVEIDGDLSAPRLEVGKHDAYDWIGRTELDRLLAARGDGDSGVRHVVAKGSRTRLTERLRLEPIGSEHAEDLFELHADPGVAAWYDGTWSRENADHEAADRGRAWEADGVQKWMAYDRVTNELVGRGGLSYADVDGARRLELGWALRSDRWGRGYATEIGRAGLDFAFGELGAEQVVTFAEVHNTRSRAVMERLGMPYSRDIVHRDRPFALHVLDRRPPTEGSP